VRTQIKLGEIKIEVEFKEIKNIHLSVYPPDGRVHISAPQRLDPDTVRVYAISKLDWIKEQQRKMRAQKRETPREYLERESHYVWGKRYLLKIIEQAQPPRVDLQHSQLTLYVRPDSAPEKRKAVLDAWYRGLLKEAAPALIQKWEPLLGVHVARFTVQHMKTRWGSCTPQQGSIRLNTELAKKPPECLEYIVVHEMVHLLEPTHNTTFVALMDKFLPHWVTYRNLLNDLPVRHEDWGY